MESIIFKSVLLQLLLIYVNDISNPITDLGLTALFADATAFIVSRDDENSIKHNSTLAFDGLVTSFTANRLASDTQSKFIVYSHTSRALTGLKLIKSYVSSTEISRVDFFFVIYVYCLNGF